MGHIAGDSETGYSTVRFGTALLVVSLLSLFPGALLPEARMALVAGAQSYLALSGILLILAVTWPTRSAWRCRLGLAADVLVITLGLAVGGPPILPLAAAYPLAAFAAATFLQRREQVLLVVAQISCFALLALAPAWSPPAHASVLALFGLLVGGLLSIRLARNDGSMQPTAMPATQAASRENDTQVAECLDKVESFLREIPASTGHAEKALHLAALIHTLYPEIPARAGPITRSSINLCALAASCARFVRDFREIGDAGHIRTVCSGEFPTHVSGDNIMLRRLLIRLLDNVRWGVRVRLEIQPRHAGADKETSRTEFSFLVSYDYRHPAGSRDREWENALVASVRHEVKRLQGRFGKTRSTVKTFGLDFTLGFERPSEEHTTTMPTGWHSIRDQNILVFEDEESADQVTGLIRDWGANVTCEPNFSQLFYQLVAAVKRRAPFDTLVLVMHRQTSLALAFSGVLREDPGLANLRLVLVTDSAGGVSEQTVLDCGVNVHLTLPLDKPLLYNALHSGQRGTIDQAGDGDGKVTRLFSRYTASRPSATPLEILIGERDETQYATLRRILEKEGHSIYRVNKGDEALDAMTTHRFDAVVLNTRLDVMDGIEVARIYHLTHPPLTTSPVILVVPDGDAETLKECRRAGVERTLQAPIESESVLRLLHETASESRTATEPAGDADSGGPGHAQGPEWRGHGTGSSATLDLDTLSELENLGNGVHFLEELIKGFRKDTEQLLRDLKTAADRHDHKSFRDIAHSIKSSAASVGASHLHDLARQASHLRDTESGHTANLMIPALEDSFAGAYGALEEHVRRRYEQARET